jgi:putative NIF3 family GTP cyclohydrolase 1 type 2
MERVVGYKDDPERKMGLVGLVDAGRTRREWAQLVRTEFGGLEREMGCEDGERHVMAIACMNAFEPRFLDRSVEAASELASLGTLRADCAVPEIQAADVLYITGESRSLGEKVARQLGMPVLFVGHRRCERWAIRYLAELARRDLPGMEVVVVDEEESVAKRARDCRV